MNGAEFEQALKRKQMTRLVAAELLSVTTKEIARWIRDGVPRNYEEAVKSSLGIKNKKVDVLRRSCHTSSGCRFGVRK